MADHRNDEQRNQSDSLHESQERFTYCLDLSYIVYHCGDVKELHQKALVSGAKLQMTWPARYYKTGFAALTALVDLGGDEDVLVVAFRGTVGISEWMEYRSLIKHKFRTLFNETDKVVLPIWMDVLDRVWNTPGTNADSELIQAGSSFTLSESILKHLRQGKRVWLTGHSKGGAVATTAAANLICGRIGTSDAANLAGVSVVTFNSPLVFKTRFAGVYEEACRRFRIDHMRVQNEDDIVPKLPRWQGLAHVGRKVATGESLPHEEWRASKARRYLERPSAAILDQILKGAVRVCLNHSVDAIPRYRDVEGRASVQSIAHPRGHPGHQPRRCQEEFSQKTEERILPQERLEDPVTIMIVGKSGSGKSTLGNHLLNTGVVGDNFKIYFAGGGGTRGATKIVEDYTSMNGTLRVIDTPGVPSPSATSTLDYFDDVVEKIRSLNAINLLIFLLEEDRTNENQFREYRTLLKQFNYLPCEKLTVCRQPDYTHRPPSDETKENKRNKGMEFVREILFRSCMDMPFMLHFSGYSDEARQSLTRIVNYASVCQSASLRGCPSLRTFRELKSFVGKLVSRKDRLKALEVEVETQRRLVEEKLWWVDLSRAQSIQDKAFANSDIGAAIASSFIYYHEVTIRWAEDKLAKMERELAGASVDEDMLRKSEEELREIEGLVG